MIILKFYRSILCFDNRTKLSISSLVFSNCIKIFFDDLNKIELNENYFIDMLADDLNNNKPDLIVVDRSSYYTLWNTQISLDYVTILTKNKKFLAAWHPYHYLTTLKNETYGHIFDIYQREKNSL